MSTARAGRVLLLRHGETEWSRTGRHTGTTDVPLTEHGRAQARALAPLVATWPVVEVRVSPMTRARDTARLAGFDPSTWTIDPNLVEWNYGEYEGITSNQIHVEHPGWTIFDGDAPGGEVVEQVEKRVDTVLATIRPTLVAGGDVALVAHGHVLRVLASRWLEQSGRFGAHLALDAGALSVLDNEHDVPLLRTWNAVPLTPSHVRATD